MLDNGQIAFGNFFVVFRPARYGPAVSCVTKSAMESELLTRIAKLFQVVIGTGAVTEFFFVIQGVRGFMQQRCKKVFWRPKQGWTYANLM
jgi:hypothetical protein